MFRSEEMLYETGGDELVQDVRQLRATVRSTYNILVVPLRREFPHLFPRDVFSIERYCIDGPLE